MSSSPVSVISTVEPKPCTEMSRFAEMHTSLVVERPAWPGDAAV
jgi:hypothetical protein